MKLPISSPIKPTITQLYGDKSSVDWYRANGLDLTEHNGTDFIIGDSILTYGTKLVCPVSEASLSQTWWDNPMSTQGNGIQISWEYNYDRYSMRCWHCSEIVVKSSYKEGEVIGYIGNSGLCRPSPTPQKPFNGSHLHLMLYKNGILINPLTVFNPNEWYISSDTGVQKDIPPLQWALNFVKSQLSKLLAIINK